MGNITIFQGNFATKEGRVGLGEFFIQLLCVEDNSDFKVICLVPPNTFKLIFPFGKYSYNLISEELQT